MVPSFIEGSLHCPLLLHRSWYRCVAVTKCALHYLCAGALASLLVLQFLLLKEFERTEGSFKYRPSQIHICAYECERQLSEIIYFCNSGLHSWEKQRKKMPEVENREGKTQKCSDACINWAEMAFSQVAFLSP